ncbi:MAG: TnpV protein [Clostridia bacterium]|nr:TnpV protein [Clostridia bacterium]
MTEITYTRNGDYFIPDIVLKEKEHKPLGKYGRMRKDYLKNHRPALWNRYLLKDTLDDHLHEIDFKAQTHFDTLLPLYCERYSVTEELKSADQMEWIGRMNNIINAIEEIILNEIVYR